jgi:hypothetical protein
MASIALAEMRGFVSLMRDCSTENNEALEKGHRWVLPSAYAMDVTAGILAGTVGYAGVESMIVGKAVRLVGHRRRSQQVNFRRVQGILCLS